ncbi:MAG: DNA topoisomerase IV subunit B [Geminicoccaceae bacterium]
MNDLFDHSAKNTGSDYTASDIEVLEGLEPVRRRPGMYIGGTDERALHHLVAEVLDNAMDEAVAGHASRIELHLGENGVTVRDNGRGIPVDLHPKFPNKSALEVILTTLHSGGKFGGKAYQTSGGLHGVGVSVVNALAERLEVEVARNKRLYVQHFAKGAPVFPLRSENGTVNRRGTSVFFKPDPDIFGAQARFRLATLFKMARSKAYLFRGVEIRWSCDASLARPDEGVPERETFHFLNGLADYLQASLQDRVTITTKPFAGEVDLNGAGKVEWAIAWPEDGEGASSYYCNTVPTPLGGTHETGLRAALTKGLRAFAELVGEKKKAATISADDVVGGAYALLSIFIREPQFQGQTKERLVSADATRLVEQALKDRFELWLSADTEAGRTLLGAILDRAEERLARKKSKDNVARKSATRRLRLPGKLSDCSRAGRDGTELFIVEGDSAGGSAKQARFRETQAILPLRGKILNAASATADKLKANRELTDLITALGCGHGRSFKLDDLRYDKIIIMTDADVDGAHIAALLMTFFFRELPALVEGGYLYLAQPPLYRLSHGGTVAYAQNDADREAKLKTVFKGKKTVEIGRFKGLGEMDPKQLRETTMDPATRTLLRVDLPESSRELTIARVDELMGRKPETRLAFIQQNAAFVDDLDI